MSYNFDEIVDRTHTQSIKHDFARQRGMGFNAIPLWIADMDFRAPDCIKDALIRRANHGIYGYSMENDDYFGAVKHWFHERHGWNVEPHWLVTTPGVLTAVSVAINVLTKPNDAILVQTPSYDKFNTLVDKNNRRLIKNALVLKGGTAEEKEVRPIALGEPYKAHEGAKYEIDFVDFERQIVKNNVKLFLLCSPHNPIGRVWTVDELTKMGDICLQHGVYVISDEIFCDFVYAPNHHTVFAGIKQEFLDITVTCTAPTKTFNMSGMAIANIFIADDDIRDDFSDKLLAYGMLGSGIVPMLACRAAYTDGAEWLDALLVYLSDNVAFVKNFVQEHLPNVSLVEPEGTYMLWLDFRRFGLWAKELSVFTAYDAGVLLSGEAGAEGFLRVNAASPRSVIKKALERLAKAVEK
ncbi:pyridoxal phosphate-dependent aminotransferase [Lachnospiraceae bacterium ZAX-1]